jgi:aldehyde:ferredoxin oxidoreductase
MEGVSSCGQCLFTTYAFLPSIIISHPQSWYTKVFCAAVPFIGWALRIVNKLPAGIMHFHIPVLFNQSKALKYITGMPVTFGTFFEAGKRGYTLERHINTRFGMNRKDDSLPKRLTDEPQIPGDESTKVPLGKMKSVYYKARGWSQDGIPTPKTLRKLKIKLNK